MNRRLIGVIISGVWTVAVLLMFTVFNNAFDSDSANNAIAKFLVIGGVLVALFSFFLVDFVACLRMLWRIMTSGLRFPVIPLNLILFMITFGAGIGLGVWLPISITLLTYLTGQPTETESI